MVFGFLSALASDTLAHIAGESPVINAEKRFDQFMKSYEFAIEAQKLKREDVRDLVELIVGRMDMYHLVGALLLEFCVAFYGEFKLLEDEYSHEPCFILEIFLLSNICAIGFLLFAVWLSLHASVAAHAIGVEYLLDVNRLTIPTPENLAQMRQTTSLFRHVYQMFTQAGHLPPDSVVQLQKQENGHQEHSRNGLEKQLAMENDPKAIAALRLPHLGEAMDSQEHRRKFAQSHRAWLRFDAYSRVCMALGINQMLQALCYFIIGPVQQKRPSSAMISFVGVQAVALLLLKLDLRSTDHALSGVNEDGSDSDSSTTSQHTSNYSQDVSRVSWGELLTVLVFYTLPPFWVTLVLWLNHFVPANEHFWAKNLAVVPCFFLHAGWLWAVRIKVSPSEGDLLPVRLRTVGYLDIFTRDVDLISVAEQEEEYRNLCKMAAKKGGDGMGKNLAHSNLVARRQESVPWLVVGRFCIIAIVMWFAGGFVHGLHTVVRTFETPDEEAVASDELEGEGANLRELRAEWPAPAGFFEISGLHCNRTHMIVSSPFSLFRAERGHDQLSIGPLSDLGSFDSASLLCDATGCDVLARARRQGFWQIAPLGTSASNGAVQVPIPQNWELVTGARVPCKTSSCQAAFLVGWDNSTLVAGDLRREYESDEWKFRRRFVVHQTIGQCAKDENMAVCHKGGYNTQYADVRALQLDATCWTLMVLLGSGTLEQWDLSAGSRIGRWQIRGQHTSMCHDGQHLVTARRGSKGPVLETRKLPRQLQDCKSAMAEQTQLI